MVKYKFMTEAERELRNQHFADFHRMMHERRMYQRQVRLMAALKQDRHRGVIERMWIRIRNLVKGITDNG